MSCCSSFLVSQDCSARAVYARRELPGEGCDADKVSGRPSRAASSAGKCVAPRGLCERLGLLHIEREQRGRPRVQRVVREGRVRRGRDALEGPEQLDPSVHLLLERDKPSLIDSDSALLR